MTKPDPFVQASVTASWNGIADWWVQRLRSHRYGDPFRRHLLTPLLLELLAPIEGCRILDYGCGEGYMSRILAAGAAQVVGMDVSENLLQAAAAAEEGNRSTSTYVRVEREVLHESRQSFDQLVCNMVLMDVPDYQATLRDLRPVMMDGGTALWSILHPGTFHEGRRWLLDPERALRPVPLNDERGRWAVNIRLDPEAPGRTPYFHRTVGDYTTAFQSHGFDVVEVHEPAVPPVMTAPWLRSLQERGVMSPVLVFETEAT